MTAPLCRVGVNLDLSTAADVAGLARSAETAGFDFVSSSDHPCGHQARYEVWTALCWAAAATSTIGIATRVLATPMRSPAMTAKMAESLDRLSVGRFVLGLGSGHNDEEFRAFGLRTPTPREKVDGLRDAIRIARSLWSGEVITYEGRVHHVTDAQIAPPARRGIPIWLGTYGPRALALTGELADGWIPSLGSADREDLTRMLAEIRDRARRAGRPEGSVVPVLNVVVELTSSSRASVGDIVTGSPIAVRDALRGFLDRGFEGFNLMWPGADQADGIRRLGEELLPLLR